MTLRTAVAGTVLTIGLSSGLDAVRAQQVTFDPSLQLEEGYTSNVEYTGAERSSDTVTRVQLELPVERETAAGKLQFHYRPVYVKQRGFDELDRGEHSLGLRWSQELSRANRFATRVDYSHTQEQGTPQQGDDPDLFLTRRTNRDRARAEVSFTRQEGPRWDWSILASGSSFTYHEISGFEDTGGEDVEDRVDYGGALGLARRLSRESSLGLRYAYRRFDLDVSGQEDSNQVSVTYESRLAQGLVLSLAGGAFRSSGDTLGESEEKTGAILQVGLSREYETFRLQLDASHLPSAGGALNGTATESFVRLSFASSGRQPLWRWQVAPRFASREPSEGGATIDSYGIGGEVERRFARRYAVRLRADQYDESDREGVFRTGLSFVWYPLAGDRRSGRS